MTGTIVLKSRAVKNAIAALKQRFGDQLSTSASDCDAHGRDESFHEPAWPDAVLFAQSTEDVSDAVKLCVKHDLPVVPFGVGTSLEGHVIPIEGGLSLDLSRMDQVIEANVSDLDCTIQAGVTRKQLNTYLRHTGLFFPVDPGADATLGGMCATAASGTNAVRYGTMRENVLGLEAVLANGDIVSTGGRARKSSAGYDLTRLLIGSEGTLGVITQVTLRLYGIPEAVSACVCPFETLNGAVESVIATIQMGLPVARIELLDELQIRACNLYANLDMPEQPTLFLEFHGTAQGINEDTMRFKELALEFGGGEFSWATHQEDRNRLWAARHDAAYATTQMRAGSKLMTTDVCVPISRLAQCILETRDDLDQTPLVGTIAGHVGDGNFHVILALNADDPDEVDAMDAFNERLIERALSMNGTCTGEHGIGLGKMDFLKSEHGDLIKPMRLIKQALDPQNLLNPGKIFDLG